MAFYLQGIPDVGEKVDINQTVDLKHLQKRKSSQIVGTIVDVCGEVLTQVSDGLDDLDKGVVDDAGEHVDDVEDGEGHQQVVERGSHLRLPETVSDIKPLIML